MKRILIIPKNVNGIVDVRKHEYFILEEVNYVEQILSYLLNGGRQFNNYKFCAFEVGQDIPLFINVSDRMDNGKMAEFECIPLTWNEVESDDREELMKMKFLNPIITEKQAFNTHALEIMVNEWLGVVVSEADKKRLKSESNAIEKRINSFDYKKHLKESV